jgi:hypothetical protein
MATQYTSILKLALPVTGELSGTWGDVVNNNITSMVEQAIAGLSTINTWTANAHTLTVADGTTSESRCAMLVADTGAGGTALTAAGEIICPAASKLYVLKNGAAYAVTLKTAAGTGVAVPAGDTAFLFCDGTNVNACVTTVVNGHISGNLTVDGNTTLGDANTDTVTVNAQFNTDLLPSTDNARDLGSTAKSWRTLYCDTSVLVGNLSLAGNTLSSTDTNGNIVIAPNGTGDVQLDADTVRVGDSNANATITTNGTGDLILNTNAGTNSGSITIEDGVNGNIIIAPNGTGQVQITNAALDLTTIEVSNINAKDGTAAITIADSTGAVGISTAVTMSATTQNIALGTSQTTGTWTAGGASQTGALTLDQSTKTHTLNLGTGATESGLTKTVNIGTGGVSTSTTAINIGSANGTTLTINSSAVSTPNGLNFDSDTFVIDATNNRVGIGTNAPVAQLQVNRVGDGTYASTLAESRSKAGLILNPESTGSSVALNISKAVGGNAIIYQPTNSAATTAYDNIFNPFGGNVGIGTVTPTNKLTVDGNANVTGNTTLGDATTDTVTVNGYMSTGGAANASNAMYPRNTALTGTTQTGVYSAITGASDATSAIYGVVGDVRTAAAAFTVTNVSQFLAADATKGAGSTITNQHGIRIADQTQGTNNYGITSLVSSGTNKWNIYASGTANNAFAGNVRIGSTTAPTNALDVTGAMTVSGNVTLGDASTDTVTVNGYMGVGGAGTSGRGIQIVNTALVGTAQEGIRSQITGTSGATSDIRSFISVPATAAASFTVTEMAGFFAANATLGAGSTITNQHGVYIADQSRGTNNYGITSAVSSGTNKWNIYASGTAANYFAGNVGIGTSSPDSLFHIESSSSSIIRLTDNDGSVEAGSIAGKIEFENFDATSGGVNAYIQGTNLSSTEGDIGLALGTGRSGSPVERLGLSLTEAVFNDPGNDYDFRVESDTNTHALFVEGSSGNVGIGTSSPVSVLDVAGTTPVLTIKDTQSKTWAPNDTVGDLDFYSTDPSGTGPRTVARVRSVADANATTVAGALSFWTSAADSAATEKVRITSAGNVGIGTNSPGAKLDVNGSINIASTQNLQWGSSALAIAGASNILTFYTSSSERLRIDSSGALIAKPAAGTGAVFNEDGVDADFRVESDTNTHALFVEGTNSNVKIGGSAERATTVGTNHLDIFNGTAPVGTLTNGISLYSSSGEAYVMDAAGNATLFSPHDRETNEWIFKSKHTPTGKVLKIDVERLLKFVNDHFGLDAVHEFIED